MTPCFHPSYSVGINIANDSKIDPSLSKDHRPKTGTLSKHSFQVSTPASYVPAEYILEKKSPEPKAPHHYAPQNKIHDHHIMKDHSAGKHGPDLHTGIDGVNDQGKAGTYMAVDDIAGHCTAGDSHSGETNIRGKLTPPPLPSNMLMLNTSTNTPTILQTPACQTGQRTRRSPRT